ncbi:MAG: hypothetical protein JWN10_2416, partial [Solirubrobacterales bacterium]|nr:hypothetical protein [Solirubrobacterales bacterium]
RRLRAGRPAANAREDVADTGFAPAKRLGRCEI